MRRSESFLGIHFDFHAGEDCQEIGKYTTEAMIEEIILRVKPDYLQCDCKGHEGLSSYPTTAGNAAPGFVGDPLKIWRDVTKRHEVALYMHYSGVWDKEAVKQHPDWARLNEAGKPDDEATSVFGPYVDLLLIPQLKELFEIYGVDGVWVDGECWGTKLDYHPEALKQFTVLYGDQAVPKSQEELFYFEFQQINRQAFLKYVNHYVNELHRVHPEYEIASNWAFSSFMPQSVSVNVDFLSGDLTSKKRLSINCV